MKTFRKLLISSLIVSFFSVSLKAYEFEYNRYKTTIFLTILFANVAKVVAPAPLIGAAVIAAEPILATGFAAGGAYIASTIINSKSTRGSSQTAEQAAAARDAELSANLAAREKAKKDAEQLEVCRKNVNQMNQRIKKDKTLATQLDRVDQADTRHPGDKPHVHLHGTKTAINFDGTFRHKEGTLTLTRHTARFLKENGWTIPSEMEPYCGRKSCYE